MTEQTRERPILFSGPMVRAILDGDKTQTRRMVKPQPPEWATWVNAIRMLNTQQQWVSAHLWQWVEEEPKTGPLKTLRRWPANTKRPWLGDYAIPCPYGKPGDRLWVRETWRAGALNDDDPPSAMLAGATPIYYEADGPADPLRGPGRLRPSIHMPRWASRITLEITGVRVERLQDISEDDAKAEGCTPYKFPGPWWQGYREHHGVLIHQESIGETPPDWMIEPKPMRQLTHLDRSAAQEYQRLWDQINGAGAWDKNTWVWVIEFKRVQA